jgi:serine/threonine-protein kinase
MGSVYEAVHQTTGKRLAVKVLAPHLSSDLKLVTRFRREAIAASRLTHENCVHVHDFGEDKDGTFYIAMELVTGRGLADELRASGPMSTERVARIGVQLLGALDAAHTAGVLHRDLKPQNVMLMQKPNRPDIVKVVDFGIAKLTTNDPRDQAMLTVPGAVFGTPEYMSPEQARGEVLDARSDLYSAAVVLLHLLLGRSPFRGDSVRETLLKVFANEPPLIRVERPNLVLPEGFEAVLRKALAKPRDERWSDAASFAVALAPFVAGATVLPVSLPVLPGLPVDGGPPPETLSGAEPAARSSPVAASPVAASPVAASPVAASPVAASPVAASPVAASPVAASPVAASFGAPPSLVGPTGTLVATPAVAPVSSPPAVPSSVSPPPPAAAAAAREPAVLAPVATGATVPPPMAAPSTSFPLTTYNPPPAGPDGPDPRSASTSTATIPEVQAPAGVPARVVTVASVRQTTGPVADERGHSGGGPRTHRRSAVRLSVAAIVLLVCATVLGLGLVALLVAGRR